MADAIKRRLTGNKCPKCGRTGVPMSSNGYCKTCRNKYEKQYHDKNPSVRPNRDLKHRYGITSSQRKAMSSRQGGKCAGCGKPTALVVDHSHSTGRVRALLCKSCNAKRGS